MQSSFTVVYDACVLYPAQLRDLLMHLAMTDLFRAKWSTDIHDEWIAALLRDRPDDFVADIFDLDPAITMAAIKRHKQSLKNPPKTWNQYLDSLIATGLRQTTELVRQYLLQGLSEDELAQD